MGDQMNVDGCGVFCEKSVWHGQTFDGIPDEMIPGLKEEVLSSICFDNGEWIVISVMAPAGTPRTALMYAPASETPPFSIIVNGERVYENLRSVAAARIWSQVVGGNHETEAHEILDICRHYFRNVVVMRVFAKVFPFRKVPPKNTKEEVAKWLAKLLWWAFRMVWRLTEGLTFRQPQADGARISPAR